MAKIYNRLDYNGILSDFISDPKTSIVNIIPYIYQKKIKKDEKVSVIVATRNNGSTIIRSIESLIDQQYTNLEIIIVDDGSEDNSLQLIEMLRKRDKRVTVISNPKQIGTGASRNKGLSVATGKYVTFQDGDDYSVPSRISKQVETFKDERIKVCLCNYVRINDDNEVIELNDRRVMKCVISMMFRKKEVVNSVGYFPEKSIGEDSEYYQMIKSHFGNSSEKLIFRTLYRAQFRPESSFFSNTIVTKINRKQYLFEPLNEYVSK